jgi:F0F1-type ATP synthase membrane subunit c/vacuolar-type H+-ATPase subunit K
VQVAPPPPPASVVHAQVRHHAKRQVAKAKATKPTSKPNPVPAKPVLAAAGPVAATSTPGTLSPALLVIAFGVALALLAVGVSFMPASAVPFALGLRLERSRQTIMLFGLAIGVACVLVGLLTAVVGR